MCVFIYVYICVYKYMYMCVCVCIYTYIYTYICMCVYLFRATHAAFGRSQARGQTGAAAAGIHQATATTYPSHICDLYHSSQQHQILNPLSEARG